MEILGDMCREGGRRGWRGAATQRERREFDKIPQRIEDYELKRQAVSKGERKPLTRSRRATHAKQNQIRHDFTARSREKSKD